MPQLYEGPIGITSGELRPGTYVEGWYQLYNLQTGQLHIEGTWEGTYTHSEMSHGMMYHYFTGCYQNGEYVAGMGHPAHRFHQPRGTQATAPGPRRAKELDRALLGVYVGELLSVTSLRADGAYWDQPANYNPHVWALMYQGDRLATLATYPDQEPWYELTAAGHQYLQAKCDNCHRPGVPIEGTARVRCQHHSR